MGQGPGSVSRLRGAARRSAFEVSSTPAMQDKGLVFVPLLADGQLLFIHIPKNAGKSVESHFLGPSGPALGSRGVLNRAAKLLLNATTNRRAKDLLLGSRDYTFAAQHLSYREIVSLGLLDRATLATATAFAIVRNPYDRAISSVMHHFSRQIARGEVTVSTPDEFARALGQWLDTEPRDHNLFAHRRSQFDFLSLDGRTIAVEERLCYERLAEDFPAFLKRNNLPGGQLGWNGRQRKARDWRELYNDAARALVRREFERDFDTLGYAL